MQGPLAIFESHFYAQEPCNELLQKCAAKNERDKVENIWGKGSFTNKWTLNSRIRRNWKNIFVSVGQSHRAIKLKDSLRDIQMLGWGASLALSYGAQPLTKLLKWSDLVGTM